MSKKKTKVRVGESTMAGAYVGVGTLLMLFGIIVSMKDETAGLVTVLLGMGLIVYAIAVIRK